MKSAAKPRRTTTFRSIEIFFPYIKASIYEQFNSMFAQLSDSVYTFCLFHLMAVIIGAVISVKE